jgi:hypothetical protein
MTRRRVLILVSLLLPGLLAAQTGRPVIKFTPLQMEGIGIEESRLIETLIQSYLSDIGEVINYFDTTIGGKDPFSTPVNILDSWAKIPDYVLSGSISLDRDNRIFSLYLHNTGTGDTGSFTAVYRSSGELLLKARSLLESAFTAGGLEGSRSEKRQDPDAAVREILSERQIPGTWRGEVGIEMIRLQRGGRGVAVFSSGAQMVLSWVVDDNTLKVQQLSPNSERFYHPLPYETARQAAEGSGPMVWELSLFEGGTVLRGLRISTALRIEGNRVVEFISEGDIRKVEWTKGTH